MSITYNGKSVLAIYRNGTAVEQALIAWNWTPRQLYFGGVRGAAYVPDASTVYGSGAASFGAGIPTILDEKNGPPVIGPELVVNGDFATGTTGWTTAGNWVIAAGVASHTAGSTSVLTPSSNHPVAVGSTYLISVDVTHVSGSGVVLRLGAITGPTANTTGTYIFIARATATTNLVNFTAFSTWVGSIDNISVKEVSGNPATQASTSPRPLLGRAPLVKRNIIPSGTHNFSLFADEVNSEIIANNVMGPDDNPTSASSFQVDNVGGTGQCRWYSGVNFVSAGTFTYSIWLKKGTERYVALLTTGLDSPTSDNLTPTIFDLENGVISSDGEGTGKIVPYTNGWYRCSASFTIAGTDVIGDIRLTVANQSSNGKTINLDGSIVFYGYGPQVERGSTATTYQKVISSLDITEDGVTSFPFIRMDLSDDVLTTNVGSTKNLTRFSEEFDNAAWIKVGTTVVGKRITETTTTGQHIIYQASLALPSATISVDAKADGRDWLRIALRSGGSAKAAYYNLATGEPGTVTLGLTSSIQPLGDGVYRCIVSGPTEANASGFQIGPTTGDAIISHTGDGVSGIIIDRVQTEVGSTATEYEYGGLKGTSLVAGRKGTAVESITLPDGNFTLGPTAVTSSVRPGLLRAVGDIVGYNVINKTLTSKERKYLIEYYKDRGAKGMLVAGPELVTNGTFDTTDSWTLAPGWNITSDRLDIVNGGQDLYAGQFGIFTAGKSYQINFERSVTAGQFRIESWTTGVVAGNRTFIQRGITGSGLFSITYVSPAGGGFTINTDSPGVTAWIDNISIKELRPEEEWV